MKASEIMGAPKTRVLCALNPNKRPAVCLGYSLTHMGLLSNYQFSFAIIYQILSAGLSHPGQFYNH